MANYLYNFRANVNNCTSKDSDNVANCYLKEQNEFVNYFETLEGKLNSLKRTCQKQNFLMIQTLYRKIVHVSAIKLYFAMKDFSQAQIAAPPPEKKQ